MLTSHFYTLMIISKVEKAGADDIHEFRRAASHMCLAAILLCISTGAGRSIVGRPAVPSSPQASTVPISQPARASFTSLMLPCQCRFHVSYTYVFLPPRFTGKRPTHGVRVSSRIYSHFLHADIADDISSRRLTMPLRAVFPLITRHDAVLSALRCTLALVLAQLLLHFRALRCRY